MGASGLGGGGKRGVNTELNLVPFIDLLSTLICFLLITAVWQQLSMLTTNTSSTTSNPDNTTPPPEKKVDLSVTILMDRIETAEGERNTKLPHVSGQPDYNSLTRILGDWKSRYPTRSDVIIYSDSQAPYNHLVRLMDTLVSARFEDVGVNTN